MKTVQEGSYGANIFEQDGEYMVLFLYNMNSDKPSDAVVHSRKCYKSMKMAERKIAAYIAMQRG